jgi:geranylgeranyl reductase family protein
MQTEIAVVGGGPAGAWAAARLAQAGASVVLIDGSHPREKPCGGGVTGRALALVGAGIDELAGSVPIRAARFEHRGRHVDVPLSEGATPLRLAVVPRRSFDAGLLERAARDGAVIHPSRAVEITRDGSGWSIASRAGQLRARWLIGADGPGSLVRRRVSTPFARSDLSIAAGYYVHGVTSDRIEVAFEESPPGYLWSFPRAEHLAVGACAQADETTSAELLAVSDRWIDTHVSGGRRERYSWPIPSLRAETLQQERPAGAGWMLAGDAAGLVDPITREGIFFALVSADYAAASILGERDPAVAYVERLRDTVYPELMMAAQLKARFYRPRFMGLFVSALQRSERIRRIMADLVAGEQPYHTLRRRLLQTFELRLMLELFGLKRYQASPQTTVRNTRHARER